MSFIHHAAATGARALAGRGRRAAPLAYEPQIHWCEREATSGA